MDRVEVSGHIRRRSMPRCSPIGALDLLGSFHEQGAGRTSKSDIPLSEMSAAPLDNQVGFIVYTRATKVSVVIDAEQVEAPCNANGQDCIHPSW